MAYEQFGVTWWGREWLKALGNIDYSNRLPRGTRYARNGSVISVSTNLNVITAKVQGSQSQPYTIKMILKPLSQNDQQKITTLITSNPYILAQLLNHKIPQNVNEILLKENIQLFPGQWSEIDGSCSCPDWAVPCKHLAAVIYKITQKIDNDPFVVFYLRNCRIDALIQQFGVSLEKVTTGIFPLTFLPKTEKQTSKLSTKECLDQLDFTKLPDLVTKIIDLLSPSPPFYTTGNFKDVLTKGVNQGIREAESVLCLFQFSESKKYSPFDHNELILDETLKIITDIRPLWEQFKHVHLADTVHLHHETAALLILYHWSLHLLARGCLIPRLITLTSGHYRIQWIPALSEKTVKEQYDTLCLLITGENIRVQTKKQMRFLSSLEQVNIMVDIVFTKVQQSLLNPYKKPYSVFEKIFFLAKPFTINDLPNKENLSVIAIWLQTLQLHQAEYIPVVEVDDMSNKNFALQMAVKSKRDPLKKPERLHTFLCNRKYAVHHMKLLQHITLLSEQLPELTDIVASSGTDVLSFTSESIAHVLFDIIPKLSLLGIPLVLPKGLDRVLRPKASVVIRQKSQSLKSYIGLSDMLEFNWQLAIGNHHLSIPEFLELMKLSKGIIKWKDSFVYFEQKEIEKLFKQLEKSPQLPGPELLRAAISGTYHGANVELTREVTEMIRKLKTVPELSPPVGLSATLRPYQLRGFSWMYHTAQLGFGSLLADDMGLGKTIQMIALLLQWKQEGKLMNPALIVVPTSLITNWQKECTKFAPSLATWVYHGGKRHLPEKLPDAVITSYGLIRQELDTLKSVCWSVVIADEAQNIKNPGTVQSKAVKALKRTTQIAATGTPVENRLMDYWSISEFINPGYLGNQKQFITDLARPIEVDRDQNALTHFRNLTDPFIRRRLKTDPTVISDLPPKIVTDQFCTLTKQQAALYQAHVDKVMKMIESSDGIERKGLVFSLMTGLKQICNHLVQFLKDGSPQPDSSGKTGRLLEILDEIYDNQEKILIFSQYTQMGELLMEMIKNHRGAPPLFFYGGLSRDKRDATVDAFQTDPQHNIMIVSLKAGGTGLNLTAANHVVHYDLWWNPAVENQATDRAYRIGQTKTVNVYRFITQNTFEEKIDAMIKSKQELSNLTVATGENWIGELSNKELRELFAIER